VLKSIVLEPILTGLTTAVSEIDARKKAIILGFTILLGIFLEAYIHLYLRISIVYTHYFYLVIILAGLWYYQRAIIVALFFGGLQVAISWYLMGVPGIDSFLRAAMFVIVAFVVGTLSGLMHDEHLQLRDMNSRLSQSKDAYELANRKLNLLSGITRHDILNQITALSAYIDLAKEMVEDPEVIRINDKMEGVLERIRRQITFTKEYQDIGVHAPQWQDAGVLIDRVREVAENASIRLENDIHDLEIYADPLLEKIFYNLVDNAVRHGGKLTVITFSYHIREDGAVITCEDDGDGIPADEKERIFEKGFGKHTGFGLFLTREILAITKIAIRETGVLGSGARFEITVPNGSYRVTG
jgi:signal transduction histidine kinase